MSKSTANLVRFFTKKGRTTNDVDAFFKLKPPVDLGFPENYELVINKEINEKYFNHKMKDYFSLISGIYNINEDDLQTVVLEEKELLSIRIADEETKDGEISLSRFDYVIQKLSDILLKTADFVLENKIQCDDAINNPKANSFLNACKFLQTQKGSFVTRIALPGNDVIKPGNLFDDGIKAKQINEKFFSMMSFVNNNFFSETELEIDETFIRTNKNNINIDILRDMNSLYKHGIRNMEFSYIDNTNYNREQTKPNNISPIKIEKFSEFLNKIEKDTIENTIESFCYVIGVYDRMLEGGKKYCVNLISEQFGPRIEIHLDDVPENIQRLAIDAYKEGQRIRIEGEIDELKSYLKITELKKFKDIEKFE